MTAPVRSDDWSALPNRQCTATVRPVKGFLQTYPFSFRYRGEYTVGVEAVSLRDPLGLFTFSRKPLRTAAVTVYPRPDTLVDIPPEPLADKPETRVRAAADDYSNVSDIRKYTANDSYKHIHWKLSAKRNELVVKNYRAAEGNKYSLLLDTEASTLAVEDAAIGIALALAERLLNNNSRIELAYTDGLTPCRLNASDASEYFGVYSQLARLEFSRGTDMTAELRDYTNTLEYHSALTIITHRLDNALADAVLTARERAYSVTLVFLARNRSFSDEARIIESLEAAGIVCTVRKCYGSQPTEEPTHV